MSDLITLFVDDEDLAGTPILLSRIAFIFPCSFFPVTVCFNGGSFCVTNGKYFFNSAVFTSCRATSSFADSGRGASRFGIAMPYGMIDGRTAERSIQSAMTDH